MANAINEVHRPEKLEQHSAAPHQGLTERLHDSAKTNTGAEAHVAAAGNTAKMVKEGSLPPCHIHECGPGKEQTGNDKGQPARPEIKHEGTGATGGEKNGHAENHHAQKANRESAKHHHKHHHHKKHHRHGGGKENHGSETDGGNGSHEPEDAPDKGQKPGAAAPDACKDQGGDQKKQFQDMLKGAGIKPDSTGGAQGVEGSKGVNSDGKTVGVPSQPGSSVTDGRNTDGQKPANDGVSGAAPGGANSISDGRSGAGPKPGNEGTAIPKNQRPGDVTDGRAGTNPKPGNEGITNSANAPRFEGGAQGDSPPRSNSPRVDGRKGDSPAWMNRGTNIIQSGPDLSQTYSQNFKVNIPFGQAQA